MAFSESWVEGDPDGSVITVSLLDDYTRAAKRQIRERLEGDPANANSGIFESGTFGNTAIVRAGTARAYAVTFANLGTLALQDGRLAITTDTARIYHLRGAGLIEAAYAPIDGSRPFTGVVTFNAGIAVIGGITVTGTISAAGFTGPLTGGVTGNASTATVLQTARNINGVSFNGSADITIAAAAGSLTGAVLAAGVTSSSLTSVGTLTSLAVTGNVTAGSFTGPLTGAVTGNVTGNVTGTVSGNAGTATALQTARNINGVAFNGTADITVAAPAGTLTGATLAAGITASSLTSVGTLTAITVSGLADLGSFKISGGAVISKILSATKVWDPASTGTGGSQFTTVNVPGAAIGDPVLIGQEGLSSLDTFDVGAFVSAADTVQIQWKNKTTGTIDPLSTTFRVIVFHI